MQRLYPLFQRELDNKYSKKYNKKLCPRTPNILCVCFKQFNAEGLVNLEEFNFKDQSGIRGNAIFYTYTQTSTRRGHL